MPMTPSYRIAVIHVMIGLAHFWTPMVSPLYSTVHCMQLLCQSPGLVHLTLVDQFIFKFPTLVFISRLRINLIGRHTTLLFSDLPPVTHPIAVSIRLYQTSLQALPSYHWPQSHFHLFTTTYLRQSVTLYSSFFMHLAKSIV
jgi:hypothetical protein